MRAFFICGVEKATNVAFGGARSDSRISESAACKMWASPVHSAKFKMPAYAGIFHLWKCVKKMPAKAGI